MTSVPIGCAQIVYVHQCGCFIEFDNISDKTACFVTEINNGDLIMKFHAIAFHQPHSSQSPEQFS